MTGAEHYAATEKLIERSWHYAYGDGANPELGQTFATLAQAHATLALASAVLDSTTLRPVTT